MFALLMVSHERRNPDEEPCHHNICRRGPGARFDSGESHGLQSVFLFGVRSTEIDGAGGDGGPAGDGIELRQYGIGAQILLDLGVRDMILLTNNRKTIVGLEGYGLSIADYRVIGNVAP